MTLFRQMTGSSLAFLIATAVTVSMADASPGVAPSGAANAANQTVLVAALDHCRPPVSAYGKAGGYAPKIIKRQIARIRAVSDWQAKVETMHGTQFKVWRTAKDRDIQCDTSLGSLHCVAEASPCSGPAVGSLF